MKRRLLALTAALALALTACNGAAEENTPPEESAPTEETGAPEPSVSSVQPSDAPAEAVSVYTDWSRLEPYEADLGRYTRYYEDFTDHLIPVEGGYGGPLIPFAGEAVSIGYDLWDQYYYGLATADGTVVCDPVYEGTSHPSVYDPEQERYVENGDFLLLTRTFFDGEYDPAYYWLGEYRYTVAAGDGSWVLESEFIDYSSLSDGRLMLIDSDEAIWLCDTDGTLERSPLKEKTSQLWGSWWQEMGPFVNGVACMPAREDGQRVEDRWIMANVLIGEITVFDGFSDLSMWCGDSVLRYAEDRRTGLYGYVDRTGSWVIEPQFIYAWDYEGDYAQVNLPTGEAVVIDREGNTVFTRRGESLWNCGGYYLDCTWSREEQAATVYGVYDEDFRPLPDHPVNGRKLANSYGIPATREGDLWTFWDVSGAMYTVETDAEFYGTVNGLPLFHGKDSSVGLYDPEADTWVIPMEKGYYDISPCYGLKETVYEAWDRANEYDLLNAVGELIAHVDEVFGGNNGIIKARVGEYSVFLDLNGEELFRWPIQLNND